MLKVGNNWQKIGVCNKEEVVEGAHLGDLGVNGGTNVAEYGKKRGCRMGVGCK